MQQQQQQQQQMQEEEMQRQMEQERMMQQQQQQRQVIRDDEEEEEDDRGVANQREEENEQIGYDGRGGALVQEAKRLMQNDEEDTQKEVDNGGKKIKMSKIGRKPRKGAAAQGTGGETKAHGALDEAINAHKHSDKMTSGGGFSEKDIEFMKKAIQVLCQSTNPLGKSIDFVTDDIDSMSKEYDNWKKESQSCMTQL